MRLGCSVSGSGVRRTGRDRAWTVRALLAAALFTPGEEKKKAELEEEDVEVSCTMTVHLQRFIPRKPHGEFGGWLPFE